MFQFLHIFIFGMTQEEDNLDSQVLGSSFSLSLPSEPADIRNWFSSYEYESPASDTLYDLGFSFKESQFEKKERDTEVNNKVKNENLVEFRTGELKDELAAGEKIAPDGFVKCIRDYELADNPFENERNHDREVGRPDSTLQNHDFEEPSRDVKKSDRNSEDSLLETEKRIGRKSPTKLVEGKGLIQRSSGANSQTKGVGLASAEDDASNKENVGKELAEHGFVSTRKNRCTGENNDQQNTGMVVSCGDKKVRERRKVLSEKTNVTQSDVEEVAGKWRCPQKGKPDLGPPLKQLRLERWIHCSTKSPF